MTKTEIKQKAQDELMSAMQTAFVAYLERTWRQETSEDLVAEMSRQMARVEKLFGYELGSWQRGC